MNASKSQAIKLFGQVAMLVAMTRSKQFGTYFVPENWYALATAHGVGELDMITNLQSRLYKAQSWGDPDYPQRITQLLQMAYEKNQDDAIRLAFAVSKEAIAALEENELKGAEMVCPLPFLLVDNPSDWYQESSIAKANLVPAGDETRKYDVALSYASEQIDYVREVAHELRDSGHYVFFAEFTDIQVEMWGKNLLEFFQHIFEHGCEYCVMFVSKEYGTKFYPTQEKRAALSDAIKVLEGRILPVKFDDVEIPGLPGSTKYLRASDYPARELAKLIDHKVKQ